MTPWMRVVLASVALIGLVAAGAALSPVSRATTAPAVEGPPPVLVARVERAPATREARLMGVTRGVDEASLSFTMPGRIVARRVDVGDLVAEGDELVRLDPAGLENRVSEAQAVVDDLDARVGQAAADLGRLSALRAGDAVSLAEHERLASEVRALVANRDRARAGLEEALRERRESVLRAPRAGRVAAVYAEERETVAAGAPVIRLVSAGVEVELEAPAAVWSGVRPGDSARVSLPEIGCSTTGVVTRVGMAGGTVGRLFPVHVDIAPGSCTLAPGLAARVDLDVISEGGLSVPVRAVVDPTGGAASVFAVSEGRARRVPVVPLRLVGERVAIRGDLREGDEVVTGGLVGLADGVVVEVRR